MELKEALKTVKGLSEGEAEVLLERSKELQDSGMSISEADRAAVQELKDDVDKDLTSLRKQLKLSNNKKR